MNQNGKYEIRLSDDGIIELTMSGFQDIKMNHEIVDKLDDLISKVRAEHRPVLVFCDTVNLGESDEASRKNTAEVSRRLDVDRFAIMGGRDLLMKIRTNLILKAVGMANFRYFEDEASARSWLAQVKISHD